jgi:hypothetical protein
MQVEQQAQTETADPLALLVEEILGSEGDSIAVVSSLAGLIVALARVVMPPDEKRAVVLCLLDAAARISVDAGLH